jgi:hypothetical protein
VAHHLYFLRNVLEDSIVHVIEPLSRTARYPVVGISTRSTRPCLSNQTIRSPSALVNVTRRARTRLRPRRISSSS